jgi:hypothetical protein
MPRNAIDCRTSGPPGNIEMINLKCRRVNASKIFHAGLELGKICRKKMLLFHGNELNIFYY